MRRILSDRQWQKAASLLVVLYTLCIIGPAAAFASNDSATAAHCLTDDHLETAKIHVHHDGSSHRHSLPDSERGEAGKCCGLFALNAITPAIGFVVEPHFQASHLAPLVARFLAGCGSNRIDRPPRSLLSL
jgi:hypothetical protein